MGLPLGSKVSTQRPSDWTDEAKCGIGQIVACSACSKVVGVYPTLSFEPEFLDTNAGLVLERRFQILQGAIFCGPSGCDRSPSYLNPVACSDECESRILFDPRFEECDPGEDYKRFSAGLVEE
jgi:DNA-directed RNA polymerase subunit RPC12/RpoP